MVPHILRLPVELHLSIIDKLELRENVNFGFTNRYFRSIIKTPSHSDYLAVESDEWARNRGLFACSGCSRFRRFEEFADDMKKGKCAGGGIDAETRLCLNCGVTSGLYAPGAVVIIYGKAHVLCRLCRTFTHRVDCQAAYKKTSPVFQWLSVSSKNTDHYACDRISTRSARVEFDRTPTDELYGVWLDSWAS
jgi:hypothetical protein